jgi:hypothetical protein
MTNSKSTFRNESQQDSKEIDFGFEEELIPSKKNTARNNPPKPQAPLNVIDEEQLKGTIRGSQDIEQERVETEEIDLQSHDPDTPTGKASSIKPMYFYAGNKLVRNEKSNTIKEAVDPGTLSQKLREDDDICVNGDTEYDPSRD